MDRSSAQDRVTRLRRCLFVAFALCSWLSTDHVLAWQDIDETKAAKVKAAYLNNFVKFVRWPDDAFADENAPLVIGVVDGDAFARILDRTVHEQKVGNRSITIKRIKAPATRGDPPEPAEPALDPDVAGQLRHCHVIYIGVSGEKWFPRVLEHLHGDPVLTVSDVRSFALEGGMIELVLEGGRIVFHINRQVAEECGLRMSSKLLKLAKIVKSRR